MKLLVIDDDEISLCQVTVTSSCIGLTIYQAGDAEQGIKILETINEPMIVIVDVMMPGNDGFTFCQLARNISLEHSPYIIAYSSLSEKEVLIPILESGADDFVQKGNCKNILLARINVAIRNIENRKEQSQRLTLLDNEITRAQNHHLLNIQLMNLIAFHFKFTASQCDTQNSAKELLHWTDYMFMIGEGLHREREFIVDELINCMSDYFGKSINYLQSKASQHKNEQKKYSLISTLLVF